MIAPLADHSGHKPSLLRVEIRILLLGILVWRRVILCIISLSLIWIAEAWLALEDSADKPQRYVHWPIGKKMDRRLELHCSALALRLTVEIDALNREARLAIRV